MRVDDLTVAIIMRLVSEGSALGKSLTRSVDSRGERSMTVMLVTMMVVLFRRLHFCPSVRIYNGLLPLQASC